MSCPGHLAFSYSAKGKTKMREKTEQLSIIPTVLAKTEIREIAFSNSAKGKTKMWKTTQQKSIIPTVLAKTEIRNV